jgi:ketosteroid isomerase-like protein
MAQSAAEVADQMRAVVNDRTKSRELLASLFAENVAIHHVPPGPNDGAIPGSRLADVSKREVEALARALPNAVQEDPEITVEGDAVRVCGRTSGTLADGTRIEVRTNTLFTVADGAIVGLESNMDADSVSAWRKVLASGGFEIPS